MPRAAELEIVQARIAQMTDAELVDMVQQHPEDYEPWALETGRAELQRRALAPEAVAVLEAENVAEWAERGEPKLGKQLLVQWVLMGFVPLTFMIGLVAFPFYFWAAREFDKLDGRAQYARLLRFIAWADIVADAVVLMVLVWRFGFAR